MPISMTQRHLEKISRSEDFALSDLSASSPGFGAVETRDLSLDVRIIQFPDRKRNHRKMWIDRVVHVTDVRTVNSWIDLYHTQADGVFSTVIVSGDDIRRISPLIREIHRALPSKIILALMTEASRQTSAQLLMLGCDDVLTTEMPVLEARARLFAHERRLVWREEKQLKDEHIIRARDMKELAIQRCVTRPVTPQELRVLRALVNDQGGVVRYSRLLREASRGDNETSLKGLHVIISRLRKILVSNVRIETVRYMGYCLHIT